MLKGLLLNDKFIISLILINTLTIFIQGFENLPGSILFFASRIDYAITVAFVFEMIIKMREFGAREYFHSNWNRADFTLVILSLPSLALIFFDVHQKDLSFLLILRISRVFKFLRFLKFIPGIDHLLAGVHRASRASVVVLIGFFVFIVISAVLSTSLYREMSPALFGNPLKGMFTMFQLFTIEGWYEIPETLVANQTDGISFFIRLYFVILLVAGGIFGLLIVNSIFVDAMVSDNNQDLEDKIDKLTAEIADIKIMLQPAKPMTSKKPAAKPKAKIKKG